MNVKYSYHRDPKNPKRVLTVARVREPEGEGFKYRFAYALNTVERTTAISLRDSIWEPYSKESDRFRKSRGRAIALGRLEAGKEVQEATTSGKHNPIEVVLRKLGHDSNSIVQRIAVHALWELASEAPRVDKHAALREAAEKLQVGLVFIRAAAMEMEASGNVQLAVISKSPDGSGRVGPSWEGLEFLDDVGVLAREVLELLGPKGNT